VGVPAGREFSPAPGLAGEYQTGVSGVVPVRLAGAEAQAPEESGHGDYAQAHGHTEERRLELGFRP